MFTIKLKLQEYYTLDIEINGFINQSTGEKLQSGLLDEKISFVTKYWLTDLSKKVIEEKASIEFIKNELVKKYGIVDEQGNISLLMWLDDEKDEEGKFIKEPTLNPSFIAFQDEFSTLLKEEKELKCNGFKLEEFKNVETTENYPTFYKLIQIEQ